MTQVADIDFNLHPFNHSLEWLDTTTGSVRNCPLNKYFKAKFGTNTDFIEKDKEPLVKVSTSKILNRSEVIKLPLDTSVKELDANSHDLVYLPSTLCHLLVPYPALGLAQLPPPLGSNQDEYARIHNMATKLIREDRSYGTFSDFGFTMCLSQESEAYLMPQQQEGVRKTRVPIANWEWAFEYHASDYQEAERLFNQFKEVQS